jgi:hypothetical protein
MNIFVIHDNNVLNLHSDTENVFSSMGNVSPYSTMTKNQPKTDI